MTRLIAAELQKTIVISSLAMRFHADHGWTLDILNKYLKNGEFVTKDFGQSEYDNEYYILRPHSRLDVDKLIQDGHVGELIGVERWSELTGMTTSEILERRNW